MCAKRARQTSASPDIRPSVPENVAARVTCLRLQISVTALQTLQRRTMQLCTRRAGFREHAASTAAAPRGTVAARLQPRQPLRRVACAAKLEEEVGRVPWCAPGRVWVAGSPQSAVRTHRRGLLSCAAALQPCSPNGGRLEGASRRGAARQPALLPCAVQGTQRELCCYCAALICRTSTDRSSATPTTLLTNSPPFHCCCPFTLI